MDSPLAQVAMEKLVRVFGPAQANRLFTEVLRDAGLQQIRTADELYRFGERLSERTGFEAAVGRLITVAATLRGAGKVND